METPNLNNPPEENILIPSIAQATSSTAFQVEDQMALLAITDDLTGLFNRRFFYKCLAEETKKAEQAGTCLSLMMIDVDHFKQVNDTYGHLRGDSVLAEIGDRLRNGIRGRDIVIRYAGDEFIVLLIGAPAKETPGAAERIFKSVCASPIPAQDGFPELPVTLSVGVATYPDDATETRQLIEKADQALYASKKAGRNRITVYSQMGGALPDEIRAKVISPCPVLIGRKLELAQIYTLLETAIGGRGSMLLLSGNSGIGKTRLLVELKKQAESKKVICLIGRGDEVKTNLPYHPLLEVLKSYFFSLGKERSAEIVQLLKPYENELVEIIPELMELGVTATASALSPDQKKTAISEGLVQVFRNLSRQSPLMIIIDDLHLADEATIQLMLDFSRTPQEAPVFLATAFSDDELHRSETPRFLNALLPELRKGLAIQEIDLAPLTTDQVDEMIQAMLPGFSPPVDLVKKIFKTTRGNPLFIDEMLKELVAEKALFFNENRWELKDLEEIEWPASIKDTIKKRIENLDDETREALVQAAVLGDDFNLNILREVNEKNEGFVLDLVDKARKADLIREEIPLNDNHYDFANHQIREAINDLISEETKRLLHQKVGQAVEKIFGDNIEEFIGELAFHYQQSGDRQKADEYTSRNAVKTSEFYAPKEATGVPGLQEERVPLDQETFRKATDYLRSLRTAITNFQLYPAGSKMRAESVETAYVQLKEVLGKARSLTLSEANENLLIEGVELDAKEQKKPAVSSFVALMTERGIRSLTFKDGLTDEEFNRALEVLNMRPEDIKDGGGLTQILAKQNCSHVSANERIYVALGEQAASSPSAGSGPTVAPATTPAQEPLVGAAPPLARDKEEMFLKFLQGLTAQAEIEDEFLQEIGTDPRKIAYLLKQASTQADAAFQSITQMAQIASENDSLRNVITEQMVKALSELDPVVLAETLTKEMPSTVKDLKVRENVINQLSENKIIDLVTEITREYQESSRKEYVGKVTKDKVHNLQKLLSELLVTPTGRLVLPKVYPKLIETGIVKGKTPEAAAESVEGSLSQVNELLNKEPLDLLEDKTNQLVLSLISEFLAEDQSDSAVKLLDKLLLNGSDKFPAIRLKTFQSMRTVYANCISSGHLQFAILYERQLIQFLNKEVDALAYAALVDTLEQAVLGHIKREEYEQALELLGLFGRHRDPKSERAPEQHRRLDQAFQQLIQQTGEILLANLASENKEIQVSATKTLARFREHAIIPLIGSLKKTDDLRVHKNSIEALKEIGEAVVPLLIEELDLTQPAYFLESAIEIVGALGDVSAIPLLSMMLGSFDSQVRRKAIYGMVKIEGKQTLPKIIGLLKDRDAGIRQDIVRIIGVFADDSSLPDLIDLIKKRSIYSKEEDSAVQREVCITLGKIKDERALPVLIKALKRESALSLKRTKDEEIRAAAAWAIGEFSDQSALDALGEAAEDTSTAVQVIAQAAFVKVEASLKTKTKTTRKEAKKTENT